MSEEYREAPTPTRQEFVVLQERITKLEQRRPKEPFGVRLWHTFVLGVAGTVGAIYAFGWIYDNMHTTGMVVSLNVANGMLGVFCLVMAIVYFVIQSDGNRGGLHSFWNRSKN